MKKTLFLFTLLSFQLAFSQVTLSGNRLEKDGKTYKMSEYKEVFSNADAQKYMAKARTNNTVAYILGFTGGAAIGVSIPMMLKKKEQGIIMTTPYGPVYGETGGPHGYGYAIIGAGLIGAGIPFAIAAKKNTEKALKTENGETQAFKPYFEFKSSGTAMALSYNF